MSQQENISQHAIYQKKCDLLLEQSEIRFAGLIDSMGNLLAGGFKDGITPLNDETQKREMCMEVALRTATRRDFDEPLGEVEFAAAKREKVVMISFPLNQNILLISAETNVDINKTAVKVMKIWQVGKRF